MLMANSDVSRLLAFAHSPHDGNDTPCLCPLEGSEGLCPPHMQICQWRPAPSQGPGSRLCRSTAGKRGCPSSTRPLGGSAWRIEGTRSSVALRAMERVNRRPQTHPHVPVARTSCSFTLQRGQQPVTRSRQPRHSRRPRPSRQVRASCSASPSDARGATPIRASCCCLPARARVARVAA